MADDIVTRLHRHDHDWLPDVHTPCDYCDALYEIERLRMTLTQILDVYTTPGNHPEYHEYRINGLKKEWPALFRALEQAKNA